MKQETETVQDRESTVNQSPDAKLEDYDDSTHFKRSLQELKDLCSQIRYAADYCETSFVNAEQQQKKLVVDNTKEYLCQAVVTVIDHLGSVSANLDYELSRSNTVSQMECRIDGLKQRLITCQQYSHKLALTKFFWNTDFRSYHSRYIVPPKVHLERSKEGSRALAAAKSFSRHEFVTEEEVPLFFYTCNHKPFLTMQSSADADRSSSLVLPVRDGLSIVPKPQNSSFSFERNRKLKRNMLNWKLVQNNDIRSLIQKSKRGNVDHLETASKGQRRFKVLAEQKH